MSPSWDFFGMAWFKAFRNEFGYAYYGEQRMPVMLDIPLTVVIYVCLCISIAFLIAAAGIQGKERWYTLIRLVYSLLIGSVILVSIFGHSWQAAYTNIKAPYIYRSDSCIDGKIGIRIGLYTVNITLSGDFEGNKVDYNEEVLLEDINGPATELYHALDRGLPHPILMVLEHFDIDEGGLRFGRSCKIAGHFAGILLWTAFAFWIASNIILCSVVFNGAVCFTASGVCMILAIVVYHHLNLSLGFRLPGSQGEVQLRYGWCLLSNLILGIITTLFGILMILADYKHPQKVAAFFFLETALEDHHEDYTYRYPIILVEDNKTDKHFAPPVQDNKTGRYCGHVVQENKIGIYAIPLVQDNKEIGSKCISRGHAKAADQGWSWYRARPFDYVSPVKVQHSSLNYNFHLDESEKLNSDQITNNQPEMKCNALFGRQLKLSGPGRSTDYQLVLVPFRAT